MKKYTFLPLAMFAFIIFSLQFISCNNKVSDEEITATINDSLQANENSKNITAAVHEGTVTLSGACSGENCNTDIEEKVKSIEGVESVENNITITQADTDYTLRTQVQTVISNYQGVQADVANGVIVLRGAISRSQLQPLMTELNALRPKQIDNQLAVN